MPFFRLVLLGLGILFFAGCTASLPTSFYVLTAENQGSGGKECTSQNATYPRVELGPVSFPEYLDRSEIVTRVGPNRLSLSELHHWAEPLRENFVRILAENLNSRLCDRHVLLAPGLGGPSAVYRLRVDVKRFEPLERNRVLLTASWTLRDAASGQALRTRDTAYDIPMKGKDHQAVAAAMSKALASLSRDIADTFLRLLRDSSSKVLSRAVSVCIRRTEISRHPSAEWMPGGLGLSHLLSP
jgi:hypothetical protein